MHWHSTQMKSRHRWPLLGFAHPVENIHIFILADAIAPVYRQQKKPIYPHQGGTGAPSPQARGATEDSSPGVYGVSGYQKGTPDGTSVSHVFNIWNYTIMQRNIIYPCLSRLNVLHSVSWAGTRAAPLSQGVQYIFCTTAESCSWRLMETSDICLFLGDQSMWVDLCCLGECQLMDFFFC